MTAVATILGFAPQDIKQGTGLWWYELIINIVTVIVLIGLGAILLDDVKLNTALLLIKHNGFGWAF